MSPDQIEYGSLGNCCFRYDNRKPLNIHGGTSCPCWLALIRFLSFVILTVRLAYENIWSDGFHSLFLIF